MKFIETALSGAFIVEPEPIHDERGFFARLFDAGEFSDRGLEASFPQWSVSYNRRAGTLRGLHYQAAPAAEVKLVRCTAGAIYDVIVDLRPDSPSYRRSVAVELSAENRRILYVPEGFAHGFQTLAEGCEVGYFISAEYRAELQRGVRWDDPAFGIEWPEAERTISARDAAFPDFTP